MVISDKQKKNMLIAGIVFAVLGVALFLGSFAVTNHKQAMHTGGFFFIMVGTILISFKYITYDKKGLKKLGLFYGGMLLFLVGGGIFLLGGRSSGEIGYGPTGKQKIGTALASAGVLCMVLSYVLPKVSTSQTYKSTIGKTIGKTTGSIKLPSLNPF